jgi:hypothetical protein
MEPPVNRPTYPGSAKKQGASIRKRVPILGRCLEPPEAGIFAESDPITG